MKTIKLYTLGCKVNQYDTQSIRERFLSRGFKELKEGLPADYCLINTCTVTSIADRKSKERILRCIRENPKAKLIVTGCLVENNPHALAKIKGIRLIVGKNFFSEGISDFARHTRAFLKIQDGCNNFCSYCKVPLVRGASRSRKLDGIVREAQALAEKGFKEIVLTGICLGAYGKDLRPKLNLVQVIEALEKIEGIIRIRLSSIEATDVTDELIKKMAESKKLCRHLHIPMQSGDDGILKKMNRKYIHRDYVKLIKKIKTAVPQIGITTDILVGFPGESKTAFENSIKLIKEVTPLRTHVFPYSSREGTRAVCLENKLNRKELEERLKEIREVARVCAERFRKSFIGKRMKVLIEARAKDNPEYWEGYSDNYLKVVVKSKLNLKNKLVKAKIGKLGDTS
ncbi:MAG: MiaB/RimO family radical SAM methylthiotransferase [Candidatus Omnitrophica bacterium]|nr:MiaB/RimO family radical SAM methylthiotransferase [Candidatus Omnitrophota bacterium]